MIVTINGMVSTTLHKKASDSFLESLLIVLDDSLVRFFTPDTLSPNLYYSVKTEVKFFNKNQYYKSIFLKTLNYIRHKYRL